MTFLGNDTLSPGPMAHFTEIPESPLLTLNMITPESWMVEAVQSPYDLDNIHLQEVPAEKPGVILVKLGKACFLVDLISIKLNVKEHIAILQQSILGHFI